MKQCKDRDVYIGCTTVSTEQDAQVLSNKLIEKGLIACAQLSQPIQSIYQWNGEVMTEEETKITLKFSAEKVVELSKTMKQTHPYDLPQWVYWKAESAIEYADWVNEQTQ